MNASEESFWGIRLPDGRVAVRQKVLALPSVGCSNRACDLLGMARPDVAVLTHQHGCGQFGDDLALTAETLAATASHPNVSASVIVGLGCESNQPRLLAERIRARGVEPMVVVIQEEGGVIQTAEAAARLIDEVELPAQERVELAASELTVAILADEASGAIGVSAVDAITAQLRKVGAKVLVAEDVAVSTEADFAEAGSVPAAWHGGTGRRGVALKLINPAPINVNLAKTVAAGSHDVERLTALTAMGAHLVVFVTGKGSPIGSPIAPTIKVGTNPVWNALEDVIDSVYETAEDAARTADLVLEVASGKPTAAELAGQRDFALWRTAPTL